MRKTAYLVVFWGFSAQSRCFWFSIRFCFWVCRPFLGLAKTSPKFSGKWKFSTGRVNQSRPSLASISQGNFFPFSSCNSRDVVYFKWMLQFRHLLLEVCQVHQLIIKNICCLSKWWRHKLNKDQSSFTGGFGRHGDPKHILLQCNTLLLHQISWNLDFPKTLSTPTKSASPRKFPICIETFSSRLFGETPDTSNQHWREEYISKLKKIVRRQDAYNLNFFALLVVLVWQIKKCFVLEL